MKIPEGWPTVGMIEAAHKAYWDTPCDTDSRKKVRAALRAALKSAPTPPAQKDGSHTLHSPNQNIVAIFTAILSALEQQPLGADFEKVLHDNLSELYESNTPAQEVIHVKIPATADEAELMAKLGMKWLEDNAPERLKAQKVEPLWIQSTDLQKLEIYDAALCYVSKIKLEPNAVAVYTRPQSDNSAEKIAQMLEAIKEVDVLIRNNLPVDKTTPAWGMIKKILYK